MGVDERVLFLVLKYRRILLGELAHLTGLSEEVVAGIVSKYSGVLSISSGEVVVEEPVELALRLLSMGVDSRRLSELLDWRDFEVFSSRILYEAGYEVIHSLKTTFPARLEIDVFAVEPTTGFSIAIDCKHWSHSSTSRLMEAAMNHYARVEKLVKYYSYLKSKYKLLEKTREIIPLILTLLTPGIRVHSNVLLLSIRELPLFLTERHFILDYYEVKPVKLMQNQK